MAERPSGYEAPARPVGPGDLPRVPDGPAQGAVRRTPRPTGDRQTPETGPQESAGTTNTVSPVSGDQPAVSSRVSSRPAFGDPEGPRRDPVGTVRSHDDGSRAVKVTDGLATHPWCSVTPRDGTVWLAHEDVAEWGTEREWRLEELRAKLAEEPETLFPGPECDMEAYAALPPCTACEGGGQDTHGTVFEAPYAVHFAGPPVEIDGRRRQLCMWCGHVLVDIQLDQFRAEGVLPPAWPVGTLVRIEDGLTAEVHQDADAELPPGCCALPDDEPLPCTCQPDLCLGEGDPPNGCEHCATIDGELPCPVADADDGPEHCGKHVPGTSSNRCLLRAGHTGDHSDEFEAAEAPGCCTACNGTGTVETGYPCEDCYATGHCHPGDVSCDGVEAAADGPDEAQETRAADWPAEEANS